MNKNAKIYIAGHDGLVGSAILNSLKNKGYTNFITRTREELDLTDQSDVAHFFELETPEYVFLAAAKVGGILANNSYRADFIYENLMIQNNVIHQSYIHNIKKLLFLGSTCVYPKNCPQPIKEEYLLTDTLEYTNEPYAIAKIAGLKMCESYNVQYGTNFMAVQPTNLYGPNDDFDLEKSHVIPGLIRKIHLGKALENNNWSVIRNDVSKQPIEDINGGSSNDDILDILEKYGIKTKKDSIEVEVWGSGKPIREFLWSEDMANASVFLMKNVNFKDIVALNQDSESLMMKNEVRNSHINVGSGEYISVSRLAEMIKELVGFKGNLIFNLNKPDGTMKKLTDTTKLRSLGWEYSIELEEGLKKMYKEYLNY